MTEVALEEVEEVGLELEKEVEVEVGLALGGILPLGILPLGDPICSRRTKKVRRRMVSNWRSWVQLKRTLILTRSSSSAELQGHSGRGW